MPTTILSLGVVLLLLGPGFCFVFGRERRFPFRKVSAFRETVQIAAASVLLNLAALGAFWILHVQWYSKTPNVAALVRHPHFYWVRHYQLVSYWTLGTYAFACLLGIAVGLALPRRVDSIYNSSWVSMFERFPESKKWIGCELIDGSFIGGELYSYNPEAEETGDRGSLDSQSDLSCHRRCRCTTDAEVALASVAHGKFGS